MTEIQYMFSGCTSLKTVDLSNWKTPKLSVLGRLINGCGSLTYANLSGWDVSSLYQIDVYPFSGCVNLVTLDLSGWNLDNTIVDRRLFENCNSLKTVRWSVVPRQRSTRLRKSWAKWSHSRDQVGKYNPLELAPGWFWRNQSGFIMWTCILCIFPLSNRCCR